MIQNEPILCCRSILFLFIYLVSLRYVRIVFMYMLKLKHSFSPPSSDHHMYNVNKETCAESCAEMNTSNIQFAHN